MFGNSGGGGDDNYDIYGLIDENGNDQPDDGERFLESSGETISTTQKEVTININEDTDFVDLNTP